MTTIGQHHGYKLDHHDKAFGRWQDRRDKAHTLNPHIFVQIEDVEASIKHHETLSNQTYGTLTFDNKDVDWDGRWAYHQEVIRPLESLKNKLYDAAYCNHKHSIDDGYRDICTCGAVNYGSGWFYQQESIHASTVTNYAVA